MITVTDSSLDDGSRGEERRGEGIKIVFSAAVGCKITAVCCAIKTIRAIDKNICKDQKIINSV